MEKISWKNRAKGGSDVRTCGRGEECRLMTLLPRHETVAGRPTFKLNYDSGKSCDEVSKQTYC